MQGIDIEIPSPLIEQAARWDSLKRWERRELGRALRRLGLSYREIGRIIPAARGTLSDWFRDLVLSDEAIARVGSIRPGEASRTAGYARRRARTEAGHEAVRAAGRHEARTLSADPFWMAGVVAYWAEGAKRAKNELRFSNSDPAMIQLFIHWAQRYLGVPLEGFLIRLHLHEGQDEQERFVFWSKATGLPLSQFRKTYLKAEGTGHRKNVLYNGTASVRVRSSSLHFLRVMGWIDGIASLWAASSTG
jgi:hypothetical protein